MIISFPPYKCENGNVFNVYDSTTGRVAGVHVTASNEAEGVVVPLSILPADEHNDIIELVKMYASN